MENANSNLIIKIIYLLKENRDGLILIDGKWGTGKTYFIKNTLPRYYDLNVFYYISFLGIKSIADFKAKIIDCYYLQDINTLKSGLDTVSGIASISSGSPASANVLNGMFTSIGSSVRENILSKLTGIFILDDIERLTDSTLANEILAYCHSLYSNAADSNLDFIVVSNTSAESKLELEHKEKIISDSLHYNPDPIEVLSTDILKNLLKHLPFDDRKAFEEMITYNDIVNIRVLIRALNVALPLYLHANNHQELSWRVPSSTILTSILSFFILMFSYNKQIGELIKENNPYIPKSTDDSNSYEAKLWSTLNNYKINTSFKHYYSGHISLNDVLDDIFFEAKALSMFEIATSTRPEFPEVNEKELYTTILDLIFKNKPCELHFWLKAVYNYEYLTFHRITPKFLTITLQFLNSKLIEFSNSEVIDYFERYGKNQFVSGLTTGFDDGKLLFTILKCRHNYIVKKETLQSIKNTIEFDGWAAFDVESLSKLDGLGNYKVLQVLGAPFLTRCILKKWSVTDIKQFNAFLRKNYRISNISQFATNEKNHLIYINQKLDIFYLSNKKGFKFGAIYGLNQTLRHAISCL